MYEMFMGPFEASKPWDMKGLEGVSRFLKRVYGWSETVKVTDEQDPKKSEILKNKTIAKVSDDIENFRFNTAISALMVFFNDISKLPQVSLHTFETFMKLLHPFAPHITDEIWQQSGHSNFLLQTSWPQADPKLLQDDSVEIGVQVNGKVRDRISVASTASREELEKAALTSAKVLRSLEGFEVKKVIVVPGRMVSLVAAPKK